MKINVMHHIQFHISLLEYALIKLKLSSVLKCKTRNITFQNTELNDCGISMDMVE